MPTRIAITLTEDQTVRLGQLAEAREETVAAMVQEAVSDYLDADAEFRRALQKGLDDVAAGRTIPWEKFESELRAEFGDFDD